MAGQDKILSTCFVCLLALACDKQEPAAPVKQETVMKAVPEKITPEKTRPVLDLSIDNITFEPQANNNDMFVIEQASLEERSELFKTLSKDQAEAKINLSGKLLTDDEKLGNKEYLDSIEGLQINVKGKFE